jgi:hypothetical protein
MCECTATTTTAKMNDIDFPSLCASLRGACCKIARRAKIREIDVIVGIFANFDSCNIIVSDQYNDFEWCICHLLLPGVACALSICQLAVQPTCASTALETK